MSMDLKDFERQDITNQQELDNPFVALNRWMNEAKKQNIKMYNTASFATTDQNGHPDSRQMLIKEIDEKNGSLVFYTNGESAMGQQLDNTPFVAINSYYADLDRSYRIRGQVEHLSDKESDEYWKTRNLDAQVSAVVSEQGKTLKSKEEFEKKLEETKAKAETEGEIERPSYWRGYRVYADSVELWFEGSQESRTHTRVHYDRTICRKGEGISDISGFELGSWSHKHIQP